MRPEYCLVRLKSETVQDLNGLGDETGHASLNDLITKMIRLTDTYRHDRGMIISLSCQQPPLP